MAGEEEQELLPGVTMRYLERLPPESGVDPPDYRQLVDFALVGRTQPASGGDPFWHESACRARVGDGDVPPGVELALRLLRPGERCLVQCEARFAFGQSGRPATREGESAVPPDTDVEFEVCTLGLGSADPVGAMTPAERLEEGQFKRGWGNRHFAARDFARAARCYGTAIKAVEGLETDEAFAERAAVVKLLVDCGNNMAACMLKTGDLKKAEEACVAVLHLDPHNTKALYRAGVTCMRQDRFDEAGLSLTRAAETDPGNKDVQRGLRDLKNRVAAYRKREKRVMQAMGSKLFGPRTPPTQMLADADADASTTAASATTDDERGRRLALDRPASPSSLSDTSTFGVPPWNWRFASRLSCGVFLLAVVVISGAWIAWKNLLLGFGADPSAGPEPAIAGADEPDL